MTRATGQPGNRATGQPGNRGNGQPRKRGTGRPGSRALGLPAVGVVGLTALRALGSGRRALAHGRPDRTRGYAGTRETGSDTRVRRHTGTRPRGHAATGSHGHAGALARGHAGWRERGIAALQPARRCGTLLIDPASPWAFGHRAAGPRAHGPTVPRAPEHPTAQARQRTSAAAHRRTSAPAHQRRITGSRREPSPPLARSCIITGQPVADRQDHANVLPQDGTAGGDRSLVVSRGTSSSRLGNAEKPEGGQATEDPDDASCLARSAATEPPLTEGMAPPPNLSAQDPASTDVARWKKDLFLR